MKHTEHSALSYSGATTLISEDMLSLNSVPTIACSCTLQSDLLSVVLLWNTISRMIQDA